jgi:hypothetical protein
MDGGRSNPSFRACPTARVDARTEAVAPARGSSSGRSRAGRSLPACRSGGLGRKRLTPVKACNDSQGQGRSSTEPCSSRAGCNHPGHQPGANLGVFSGRAEHVRAFLSSRLAPASPEQAFADRTAPGLPPRGAHEAWAWIEGWSCGPPRHGLAGPMTDGRQDSRSGSVRPPGSTRCVLQMAALSRAGPLRSRRTWRATSGSVSSWVAWPAAAGFIPSSTHQRGQYLHTWCRSSWQTRQDGSGRRRTAGCSASTSRISSDRRSGATRPLDGLSSNTIHTITDDRRGRLYFGRRAASRSVGS